MCGDLNPVIDVIFHFYQGLSYVAVAQKIASN